MLWSFWDLSGGVDSLKMDHSQTKVTNAPLWMNSNHRCSYSSRWTSPATSFCDFLASWFQVWTTLDPRISSTASFRACSMKWVYNFYLDRWCHLMPDYIYIYLISCIIWVLQIILSLSFCQDTCSIFSVDYLFRYFV